MGKSFCCTQTLTKKPKPSSAQGKKPKKRCTHDSTQWNFLGKKLLLYPTADKEAKIEQHAGKKVKKRDAPAPPQPSTMKSSSQT